MSLTFGFDIQKFYDSGQINPSDVEVLKSFLESEKMPTDCDEMIAVFLMVGNGDMEVSKKYAYVHYKARNDIPEVFTNRNISDVNVRKQMGVGEIGVASQKTDEGYSVIVFRLVDSVASHWHTDITAKIILMCIDSILYDDPVPGFILVIDLSKLGILHLARIKLGILRRMLKYSGDGLLNHLKAAHFINGGYILGQLFNIFKAMSKPELFKLFSFMSAGIDDSFYEKYVPKKCLPADYGGNDEPMTKLHQKLYTKMEEIQEFFDQEVKHREQYKPTK